MRHLAIAALLVSLALGSSGCAVLMMGAGHEDGSGSLSDAARQATRDSTDRKRERPPDVGYTVPPTVEVGAEVSASEPAEGIEPLTPTETPIPPVPAPRTHRLFGGLVLGGGALGGREYDGFSTAGLCFGGYPEPRVRVDGTATINGIAFREQAYLYHAFQNTTELSLDLTVRYYLTPDQTFMGAYPLAGVGTGTLFWDYDKPVTVIEDGVPKHLDSDRINYFSLFGGAGVSLMQFRYVHVGGNLIGGVRFYGWHTGSGLDNDMLRPTGYLKALIEISFRVAKV
jgi:hypothetical protein